MKEVPLIVAASCLRGAWAAAESGSFPMTPLAPETSQVMKHRLADPALAPLLEGIAMTLNRGIRPSVTKQRNMLAVTDHRGTRVRGCFPDAPDLEVGIGLGTEDSVEGLAGATILCRSSIPSDAEIFTAREWSSYLREVVLELPRVTAGCAHRSLALTSRLHLVGIALLPEGEPDDYTRACRGFAAECLADPGGSRVAPVHPVTDSWEMLFESFFSGGLRWDYPGPHPYLLHRLPRQKVGLSLQVSKSALTEWASPAELMRLCEAVRRAVLRKATTFSLTQGKYHGC